MTRQFPPLSDELKARIRNDFERNVQSSVIGFPGDRAMTFKLLNEVLLVRYFTLCHNGTPVVPGSVMYENLENLLTEAAESFYAKRRDPLSVNDYPTDFPDIVALSKLEIIPFVE